MKTSFRNHLFELVLGTLLSAFCAAVWWWEAPGSPLTQSESAKYIARIAGQLQMPPAEKSDFIARLRNFAAHDDGKPIYLLNLMRFYPDFRQSGAIDFHGSPNDANALYERHVVPLAVKNGEFPVFGGVVSGKNISGTASGEDNWNRVALMRSPDRRAFFKLLADPEYARYAPLKLGALHLALVPIEAETVLPDVRFVAIFAALIIFLAAGWLRAAGANRRSSGNA